jgi:translation elongation factor EF-1beta
VEGQASVFFHTTEGVVEEIKDTVDLVSKAACERVSSSRDMFKVAASSEAPNTRELLATLEVKPIDVETDLAILTSRIQNLSFELDTKEGIRRLRVEWVSSNETVEMFQIVPIGFGLSKIVVRCRVDEGDLDNMVALIEAIEDGELVQSVDVNWETTFPIASLKDILPRDGGQHQ